MTGDSSHAEQEIEGKSIKKSSSKRYLSLLIFPVIAVIVAIFIAPSFLDWNKEKEALKKNVKELTGREIVVQGEIEFNLFPEPAFLVGGVSLQNSPGAQTEHMIRAEKIIARPSLLGLLFGQISIEKLALENAIISLEHLENGDPNWSFPEAAGDLDTYIDIDAIEITTAKLYFYTGKKDDVNERLLPLHNIIINADSITGPFSGSGNIISFIQNLDAKIEFEAGDLSSSPSDIEVDITTGNSSFELEGSLKDWNTAPVIAGEMEAKIDGSIEALAAYFGVDENVLPAKISEIFSGGTTEIEGNFLVSGKGAKVGDLKINSLKTKGSGSLDIAFDEYNMIALALAFEYLDLDEMFLDKEDQIEDEGDKTDLDEEKIKTEMKEKGNENFNVTSDASLELDLSVEKAKYRDHEFNNFHLKADLGHGRTFIRGVSAKNLPGKSQIELKALVQNQQGQKFDSRFIASGDDLGAMIAWLGVENIEINTDNLKKYNASGSVFFGPKETKLSQIFFETEYLTATGQAVIDYPEDSKQKPTLNTAFKLEKVNFDKLMKAKKHEKEGTEKTEQSTDEFIEIQDEKRFDQLRRLNLYFTKVGIRLLADNITYNRKQYNDFNTTIFLERGIFDLREFSVKSADEGITKARLVVDARELRPKAEFTLEGGTLHIGDVPAKDRSAPPVWGAEEMSLHRLASIDTQFNIKYKKLILGRVVIDNVKLSGNSDDNALNIEQFNGQINKGHINLKGVLGITRHSGSLIFTIVNTDLPRIAKDLFGNKILTRGNASISGSISAYGKNFKQWMESLDGSLKIAARGLILDGFDIKAISDRVALIEDIDGLRSYSRKSLASGKSGIDYLAGDVFINDGEFNFRDIDLSHSLLNAGKLNLKINIPKWTTEFSSASNVIFRRKTGKISDKYVPLAVNGGGKLNDIKAEWDIKGIEEFWERKFY